MKKNQNTKNSFSKKTNSNIRLQKLLISLLKQFSKNFPSGRSFLSNPVTTQKG